MQILSKNDVVSPMAQTETGAKKPRVEVLCLTYGEPQENVWRPQYEYSLSILNRLTRRVAPIPKFVTPLLAARRGRIRAKNFNEIGWNSPLEEYSRRQVEALQQRLEAVRPEVDWHVRLVFEFRRPYIWEFLEPMLQSPPDEIILLPLYVADSDFTSGVSRTDLERFDREVRQRMQANPLPAPRYLEGFGFDERSGEVLADFIWRHCQEAGWDEEKCRNAVLILGAHGTLIRPPVGVNSGAKETRFLFGLIRRHLKPRFRSMRIGWLNHTLGGTWTFPEVADSARESHEQGIRDVVYFPFGFVADNGESQLEGKGQLEEFEWNNLLYLPCPNDDPAFMNYLALRVLERLDAPAGRWEGIGHGDPALARLEPRPQVGEPGALRFPAPVLAAVAAAFWLALGSYLAIRGLSYLVQVQGPVAAATAWLIALLIAWYKGTRIFNRLALKNLLRLRRQPQPAPLYTFLTKAAYIVVLFMAGLGMAIRYSGLPTGVRGTILVGVGGAMLLGAFTYLRNLHLAKPATPPEPLYRPSSAQSLA